MENLDNIIDPANDDNGEYIDPYMTPEYKVQVKDELDHEIHLCLTTETMGSESKEQDLRFRVSLLLQKVGKAHAGGNKLVLKEFVDFCNTNNINLDEHVMEKLKNELGTFANSASSAAFFSRFPTPVSLEEGEEVGEQKLIGEEPTEDEIESDVASKSGVEFMHVMDVLLTILYIKDQLKSETVEEIKELTNKLVIPPSFLKVLNRMGEMYGFNYELIFKQLGFSDQYLGDKILAA